MHTNESTISVITVSDDHYVVMLAALIKSIEENHHSSESINFHVVADRVASTSKLKLEKSINPCIINILWHDMDELLIGSLKVPKDKSSYPLNIYMRLFFPLFLSKQVKKVLYLDCDMIVLKDVSELYNITLNGFPLAAVKDPKIQNFDNPWGGILNYKQLGLNGKSVYFNSGMLLIDCVKWAELDISQKVIKCVEENKNFVNYPDQYGLNVVFADNWLEVDSGWNTFSIAENTSKPFIIHFTERKPIYRSYSNNPEYRDKFFFYLRLTAWVNFRPLSEFYRITKKVRNIITKM